VRAPKHTKRRERSRDRPTRVIAWRALLLLRLMLTASTSSPSLRSRLPTTRTRASLTIRATTAALALLMALAVSACTAPIAAALDEADANRILVALGKAHVDATKAVDPTTEGRFQVNVLSHDTARALSVLGEEELPRPRPSGVLDTVGKGALVPSVAAEHAHYVVGLAGDLERTLQGVDGVLTARVHLNVHAESSLLGATSAPSGKTTASVLLAHRGASPPLTTDAVQRLVAGGIDGLAPADVAVLLVARVVPVPTSESSIGYVGPIAVARGSMRTLQIGLIALVSLVAGLAAATLILSLRMTRLRAEMHDADKRGGP
jgi:type III secretion protein J